MDATCSVASAPPTFNICEVEVAELNPCGPDGEWDDVLTILT
ncbi:MAG: hypothetical protein AAFO83_07945 [Cyanobacteria bacterium J06607_13]